ncbi:MAG: gliding motility-associated C-terminal domain-containing protein, partial [Thermoanaerobaculia bacterium]|nr:gliding motility-associated C-terminal domain-containing protein [Thermoanaerobaculia bacterium]
PFTCEDQFFLTLSTTPPALNEVVIDPLTNAVVFKTINANLAIDVNAAGFRTTDNMIYCVNPNDGTLVRLDADGQATALAKLPLNLNNSYFAGDVTPDGRYLILLGTRYYLTGLVRAADLVRVDLEDPNYGVSVIPLNQPGQIFDIAFHPVTGELYGYDSGTQRLVRIDLNAGLISFDFPPSGVPFNTGSLFFDAYGRLFAYGSPDFVSDQNSLYNIDPVTGASTLLFKGPPATASDGCSCPYTVQLSKTVEPRQAFPCTTVEYTFEIVNTSRRLQTGITLEDRLPAGFTFVSVSSNPLGGTVLSQPGDNFFLLSDVNLPEGRFEIKIMVEVGAVGTGIYRNQAVLQNLPASLGGFRLSDDPTTPIDGDSTALVIQAFAFDSIFVQKAICEGENQVRLDGQPYAAGANGAVGYSWQDGSNKPYFDASSPGNYRLVLSAGCDTAYIFFSVKYSAVSVEIQHSEDMTDLRLGDSLFLRTTVINTENQTYYQWKDPQPGSLRCPDCADTWARPFNDVEYVVRVQNELGCTDSATVRIRVDKNKNVYFPNVFKPDGQNTANAYFYPSGDAYTQLSFLSVYSRWGELLFEARDIAVNDINAGWDGMFRGKPMSPGVYIWVAEVAFLDGEKVIYKGDVTLVR